MLIRLKFGRLIVPILLPAVSVNHMFPSDPGAMPQGLLAAVGTLNSVMAPPVVIWPILSLFHSVNHRLPSGPGAMLSGLVFAAGRRKLPVTFPAVVIVRMLSRLPYWVYQSW